jgi:hypothetical protein
VCSSDLKHIETGMYRRYRQCRDTGKVTTGARHDYVIGLLSIMSAKLVTHAHELELEIPESVNTFVFEECHCEQLSDTNVKQIPEHNDWEGLAYDGD